MQIWCVCSVSLKRMKHSFKVCFFFRRRFRANVSEAPEDVKMMFDEYSENGTMNIEQLQKFLKDVQGEGRKKAQAIFNNFKHLNFFQRRGLHLEEFFSYLLDQDLNHALSPSHGVLSLSSLYFSNQSTICAMSHHS